MALVILVGRQSVSHYPMHYDLHNKAPKNGTSQDKLTLTWLVISSQKSIDTLNLYEQLLLNKDILIAIVFI